MSSKAPTLLTMLIETEKLRWFAAGIGLDGVAVPLLRSEAGNLDGYLGADFDDQVSYLRHQFAGALQRGVDRLWGRDRMACQFVFVADGVFGRATPELTQRVAEHMTDWMVNPSVAFFVSQHKFAPAEPVELEAVSGSIEPEYLAALKTGLPELYEALAGDDQWELVVRSKSKVNRA